MELLRSIKKFQDKFDRVFEILDIFIFTNVDPMENDLIKYKNSENNDK